MQTAAFTLMALTGFAANSILTRLALGAGHIDAAAFTTIRLASGALALAALVRIQGGAWAPLRRRGWAGPVALFAYAAPFSFAYLRIGAAVGALVLFSAVQVTMIGWGVARGERPSPRVWFGLAVAVAGLGALLLPGAGRPDALGTGLMVLAGIAWGAYSLLGKTAGDPLVVTARAFLWSLPLALVLNLVLASAWVVSTPGVALATISGAVTSGLGYAIWYRALRGLRATQAAILQLSVPVIATLGAILVLDEVATVRLAAAGAAVLGGVALALTARTTNSRAEIRPCAAIACSG